MNTAYRSGGEIAGRFASLLLFAVAGHTLGKSGLGAFVFGLAFTGFVMIPVGLGLDRYILRTIAADRSSAHHHFYNVLALKVAIALPLFLLSFLVLHFVGYDNQAQATAWVLAPGVFADSIGRTQLSVFQAHERGGPPAAADTIKRLLSAALGIAALKLGYGVVSLGVTYSVGAIVGVVMGFALMARTIGVPARIVRYRSWRALASSSLPFAAQDLFTSLLAMLDKLILTVLATTAAVGVYGAAYRLFESTLFVPFALVGAFAAMYTYLTPDSNPPLRLVYERSIKLSVVLLMPLTVAFVVLAHPICRLIYGPEFASAALPLQLMGPGVLLIGFVTLTTSLLVSRGDPRRMASLSGIMVIANVALNFILIPLFDVPGAAAAITATEVVFAAWIAHRAVRMVGKIEWLQTTVGAVAGGLAMAAVAIPLDNSLPAALAAGLVAYLAALLAVDRLVSPRDVAFVMGMVRRRLPSRSST